MSSPTDAPFAEEFVALVELAGLVDAWLDAICIRVIDRNDLRMRCVGENHLASCPVELARQDIVAWRNARWLRIGRSRR